MNILLNLKNSTKEEKNELFKILEQNKIKIVDKNTIRTSEPANFYKEWSREQNSATLQYVYNKLYILLDLDGEDHFSNKLTVVFNESGEINEVYLNGDDGYDVNIEDYFDTSEELFRFINFYHSDQFYDNFLSDEETKECEVPKLVFEMDI